MYLILEVQSCLNVTFFFLKSFVIFLILFCKLFQV